MNIKALRLSRPQIMVLLEGVKHKILRGATFWYYRDATNWPGSRRSYSLATVKSLHKRGLVDSNFDYAFLHDEYRWGLDDRSTESPTVWTSAEGNEFLSENGFLPGRVIHFTRATTRLDVNPVGAEAVIIDFQSRRASRDGQPPEMVQSCAEKFSS
ncbi:MAG: hypothetical protein ABW047_03105 [Nitrospiraceae bacterium]